MCKVKVDSWLMSFKLALSISIGNTDFYAFVNDNAIKRVIFSFFFGFFVYFPFGINWPLLPCLVQTVISKIAGSNCTVNEGRFSIPSVSSAAVP
jgi:hypothetical protein